MAQFGVLGLAVMKIGIPSLMWRYPRVMIVVKPGLLHRLGRAIFQGTLIVTMYSGFIGAAFNAYAIGVVLTL